MEIKYGTVLKKGGHYSSICDDIGAVRKFIIYGGDDGFQVTSDVTVIALPRFVQKLEPSWPGVVIPNVCNIGV